MQRCATRVRPRCWIALRVAFVILSRAHTSIASFALCEDCRGEYERPCERRYRAEPIACHSCWPRVQLTRLDGTPIMRLAPEAALAALADLLLGGAIVALKGIGGSQLLADATQTDVVARLTQPRAATGQAVCAHGARSRAGEHIL
jgi:hydrogenase maturation protein HypF